MVYMHAGVSLVFFAVGGVAGVSLAFFAVGGGLILLKLGKGLGDYPCLKAEEDTGVNESLAMDAPARSGGKKSSEGGEKGGCAKVDAMFTQSPLYIRLWTFQAMSARMLPDLIFIFTLLNPPPCLKGLQKACEQSPFCCQGIFAYKVGQFLGFAKLALDIFSTACGLVLLMVRDEADYYKFPTSYSNELCANVLIITTVL